MRVDRVFEAGHPHVEVAVGEDFEGEGAAARFGFGVFFVTAPAQAQVVGPDHGVSKSGYKEIVSGEGDTIMEVVVENDAATVGEPLTEYGERTYRLAIVGNVD